jgi:hypothetical protein
METMTTLSSVPEAAQSSDPIEAPHAEGGEAVAAAKEIAEAKKRWSPSKKQIGLGAAAGVGSAAIVAGLLYWRGGKR